MRPYMAYTPHSGDRREYIAESGVYISTAREYIAESGVYICQIIHNCSTEKWKIFFGLPWNGQFHPSVYLRPGSAWNSPEVRAPPIIAMRAIFMMRMSCDASVT